MEDLGQWNCSMTLGIKRDLYMRFTNLTIPYYRYLYQYTLAPLCLVPEYTT